MRSGCCVSGRRGDELMSVDMLLLDTNNTAVKSSVSDPPADNNHLMATIKLEKLVSTDTVLQSAAPLLKASAKVENLTISELNETLTSCVLGKLLASGWTKGGVMLFALKCTKNGNAQTQHSHVCTATI
ncbi:unnamed protein product [Brassica oleracea]